MKQLFSLALALLIVGCSSQSQVSTPNPSPEETSFQPKLVVGIVVDQMRYDLLYRFWEDLGDDGFKKLVREGFSCENTHFNYTPTFTGPGHTSIYTGTTPSMHGIISNDWYNYEEDSVIYCVNDKGVKSVGTASSSGQKSPKWLLTTTLADELELATNGRSKTIGISLKDRSSIMPMGRAGDGAYWFEGAKEGNWVTSSWYNETLPSWVTQFNDRKLCDGYLEKVWELSASEDTYDESLPDNNPYENGFTGHLKPTFPYDLKAMAEANGTYDLMKITPWGNELTIEMAKAAIIGEEMGVDDIPDLLALSFSAFDYVGHKFGPTSREAQDMLLVLDKQLADFINFLDDQIGKNEYLIFLTADHGAVHVPSYLKSLQIAAEYWKPANMVEDVKAMLATKYGQGRWVLSYNDDQFYLNRKLITEQKLNLRTMQVEIRDFVMNYTGVKEVYTADDLARFEYTTSMRGVVQNGYNHRRSGDVFILTEPGWLKYSTFTGTHHGSPYAYDTHVPLLFYGWGIKAGQSHKLVNITDLAPTISGLLHIQMPNGTTGQMIDEVFH
jgi:predicted AlkP superfamily pyrophosphatase or phosphodiesterase